MTSRNRREGLFDTGNVERGSQDSTEIDNEQSISLEGRQQRDNSDDEDPQTRAYGQLGSTPLTEFDESATEDDRAPTPIEHGQGYDENIYDSIMITINHDSGDETRFYRMLAKIWNVVYRIGFFIQENKVQEMSRQIEIMRETASHRQSFVFFMNRAYRWELSIGQLYTISTCGRLALDYVMGLIPIGSLFGPLDVGRGFSPAEVQYVDAYRSSLLHLAILMSRADNRLIEVLVTEGWCLPCLFWTDSLGLCPLHWALLASNPPLAQYLLGIMHRVWNMCDGFIPVWTVSTEPPPHSNKLSFAEILQVAFEINLRVTGCGGALYDALLESLRLVDVSVKDFFLLDAVCRNVPKVVSRMLAEGCAVQSQSPRSFDPLHYSAMVLQADFEAQLNIMEMLLMNGADPNRLGNAKTWIRGVFRNGTPLHFALGPLAGLNYLSIEKKRIIKLLLLYGAKLHLVNDDQQMCYHFFSESLKRQLFDFVEDVNISA